MIMCALAGNVRSDLHSVLVRPRANNPVLNWFRDCRWRTGPLSKRPNKMKRSKIVFSLLAGLLCAP